MSNPRLAVVIFCFDSGPLAEEALEHIKRTVNSETTISVLYDNGSRTPLPKYDADYLIRQDPNIGANAIYHRMIPQLDYYGVDYVAYFHCDIMMVEEGWDKRVIEVFDDDPKMGLMGFAGSNEIDGGGGRGRGTITSFAGKEYRTGWSSPAAAHGGKATGVHPAVVLDACSMIFRLSLLKELPNQEETHSPGHFYDRVLSCEVVDRGYRVAVIGCECDHFSEGTGPCKVPGETLGIANRDECYVRWLESRGVEYNKTIRNAADVAVYLEGEKFFLSRWRDEKAFIPVTVDANFEVKHSSPKWVE